MTNNYEEVTVKLELDKEILDKMRTLARYEEMTVDEWLSDFLNESSMIEEYLDESIEDKEEEEEDA